MTAYLVKDDSRTKASQRLKAPTDNKEPNGNHQKVSHPMAYIEFNNVVKCYGSGATEIRALDGATFCVEQGELAIILGASGAGKTTALNILGGMDGATSGEVLVDGTDIAQCSESQLVEYRRSAVGFVFQFYNLVPTLTAKENVELAAQICPDSLDATETLTRVGLEKRLNNFPTQLSGGEQQRVALARAIVNKPQILLADEPTGNLDPENSWEIMKLLDKVNRQGTTVIVVTHNMEIVERMNKRVITMKKGVKVSDSKVVE